MTIENRVKKLEDLKSEEEAKSEKVIYIAHFKPSPEQMANGNYCKPESEVKNDNREQSQET